MKILFFLAHPAHFHLFKNSIKELSNRGYKPIVVIKTKDVLESLLISEGFEYLNIQHKEKKKSGFGVLFWSIIGLLKRDFALLKIVRAEKPKFLIGTDWSIVHVGMFTKAKSIILNEDDTKATPENRYFYPLANTLLLPSCCDIGRWEKKRVTYNSYHELAYLHPSNYKPDISLVRKINHTLDPYVVIRLVELNASHDIGKRGLSGWIIDELILRLEPKFKIFITSEKPLLDKYEKYRINANPNDIHSILKYAFLFIGDSQTMAAEAGVQSTPFIRYNDFVGKIGYLEELEKKYKLGDGFKPGQEEKLLNKLDELLSYTNLEEEWERRRNRMLNDKLNFSSFLTWFIENYPGSINTIKKDPNFQWRFR